MIQIAFKLRNYMLSNLFGTKQEKKPVFESQRADWVALYAKDPGKILGANQNEFFIDRSLAIRGQKLTRTGYFSIFGEIWLSNKDALCREFQISESDPTLLIAKLWELESECILDKLQGAFAFALFDHRDSSLKIVRDAVGARTLYIATEGETCWISPNLRKAASFTRREVDLIALRDYLCCAFVPGERSMFAAVQELRPGEIIELPDWKRRNYWSVREDYQALDSESLEWHAAELRALLNDVVGEYLPKDEDVACYLSGGLDSSSIAALAKHLHNRPLHCFSIHFGDESPNELEFSQMLAQHCQVPQHLVAITPKMMWDLHADVMNILDDPIGDPLTVPNLLLGMAAQDYARVVLNGEGGDPCFGGPKNQPMMLNTLYRSALTHDNALSTTELISVQKSTEESVVQAYLASFQKCANDLPRLLLPDVWKLTAEHDSIFSTDLNSPGHYVNKLLLINTKYKGADQILTKVNNITTALGLDGRSPLFDKRIVEASLRIPPQYKLKGAQEKAVLKEAVADLLPERIISRPKSGMMIPVQLWFRKYWQKSARQLLLAKHARIRRYLNMKLVSEWLDYEGDIWSRYGVKLWLLTALEHWLLLNTPD